MVTKRTPSGPQNPSRAAGAVAPASAAATPPRGQSGHEEAAGFYAPPDEPTSQASPLAAAFVETVRDSSADLGDQTADLDVVESAAGAEISEAQALREEIERIRAIRKPLGAYIQKLALDKRRGYHRHWFNDVAGRIDDAVNNGWAHVLGKDGKHISRVVGAGRDGGALRAYAMEIPLVFWQEDQNARHAAAQAVMDSTKANPFKAAPGTAKASDKGKFYSPTESEPLQVDRH